MRVDTAWPEVQHALHCGCLQVEVQQYRDACIWDSCGCNRGGDCECLCTAVAAYVRQCNLNGVSIHWRDQHTCRK